MEERSKEEGDQPGCNDGHTDFNGERYLWAGREDAAVEGENGEFNEGNSDDVPELKDEEDLFSNE